MIHMLSKKVASRQALLNSPQLVAALVRAMQVCTLLSWLLMLFLKFEISKCVALFVKIVVMWLGLVLNSSCNDFLLIF